MDPNLANNYRALREQRGWSWEQLAEHIGATTGDVRLAAWCRSQAEPSKPKRAGKPQGVETR